MNTPSVRVGEAAVSIYEDAFDRRDLVLAGFIDGSWSAFERSVREGLACERVAREAVDPGALRDAAVAFRRARGLVAGDELEAWLAERRLSRDDWTAHLRRQVLRQTVAPSVAEIVAREQVSIDDVAGILAVEAACDGILRRCGATVVEWAAAARDVGPDPTGLAVGDNVVADVAASAASKAFDLAGQDLPARLGRLGALQVDHARFVTKVAGDAAIRACVDEHRLGWSRLRWTELAFDREGAADEAAMCLREDGLAPGEVARLAGAELTERVSVLEEAGPALAPLLVAAQPGDVLGPLPGDAGGSRLLVVTARIPAAADDPVLRERARAALVAAELDHLVAGMVRWHEPL